METLKCEWSGQCKSPVAMIDRKGYIYCSEHGHRRRSVMPCRLLRGFELRRLERGEQVERY